MSTQQPLPPVSLSASCREGLMWVDIDWMDNGECLDLIEKVVLMILFVAASERIKNGAVMILRLIFK